MLVDQPLDPPAADLLGPERLHHHADGVRDADRIGHLHLGAVGQPRRDDVLGHIARGVGGTAVDLRGVLAAERATAVARHAAVGVDDDLAPRQPAVAHRPADHEPSRRVDQEVLHELLLVVQIRRQDRQQHVLEQIGLDQRLRVHAVAMLRGDQDLLDLHRHAIEVADGHLRLAVRAQVGHHVGLAHVGQALGELVRQRDRQRHELVRLAAGVAEHHPLVTGARDVHRVIVGGIVASLVGRVHALGDVRRLLVDRVDHRARVGAEPQVGIRVADLADRLAGHVLDVDVRVGRDLARHHDQAGVHERLARHAAVGVVTQDGIEHAVGDLVGDLVRVAFRDGLRGEQVLVVGELGHGVGVENSAGRWQASSPAERPGEAVQTSGVRAGGGRCPRPKRARGGPSRAR